jgi:hypothetical protein
VKSENYIEQSNRQTMKIALTIIPAILATARGTCDESFDRGGDKHCRGIDNGTGVINPLEQCSMLFPLVQKALQSQ